MTDQMQRHDVRMVTGFFDSKPPAERAVHKLEEIGIPDDDLQLIAGSENTRTAAPPPPREEGFWGSLRGLFLPEEERYVYAEGLHRGGYMVSALTKSPDKYDRAVSILDQEGAVDLDARERTWRDSGWQGYAGATRTAEARSRPTTAPTEKTERIPIAEEHLRIGKRDVSSGRVRVRSYVVEEPVNQTVHLRDDTVHVERHPADRAAVAGEDVFKDRTIEAEEHREEPVVGKETRVKEELELKRQAGERTEQVSDKVRRTKVDVEDERTGAKRPIDR